MDALSLENILTRRANHRHYSSIRQRLSRSWLRQTGFGVIADRRVGKRALAPCPPLKALS
jgi:hypothetical protein